MKHPFCIYLLKAGVDATNCVKDDTTLELATDASALPEGAQLYILDSAAKPVWWRDYFAIKRPLSQGSKGALLVLPVKDRSLALTFGHVSHHLKDTAYEYDFGIRFSMNSLNPDKIKNTDTLEPSSATRLRTQVSSNKNLSEFNFDRDTSIVRSLTGKTLEKYRDLVGAATGSSNLRVSSDIPAEELADFCAEILAVYELEDYKSQFSDIINIAPISDPTAIATLDLKLLETVRARGEEATLIIPDLIDYREAIYVGFRGARGRYVSDDVQLSQYLEYLVERNIDLANVNIDLLKKHEIYLCDENAQPKGNSYSIYKALVFETTLEGDNGLYHLTEGAWYRIAADYLQQLAEYIDPTIEQINLPAFNHADEGQYNDEIAQNFGEYICLDRKNISPQGQHQVEPCDLVRLNNGSIELTHVKLSTQSSTLSHLFNQGINSLDLLRREEESRNKLMQLVSTALGGQLSRDWQDAFESERYKVRYAIVTHKNPARMSRNLPLFSRISLYRILKNLRDRGVERSWGFIVDESEAEGLKKIKKAKD